MISSIEQPEPAPHAWGESCVTDDSRLHHLSPFIGRIKSRIAHDLIEDYSHPGDLVLDPFCGSGTIPLEAAVAGRRVFAADISEYSRILTVAKLFPPPNLDQALSMCEKALSWSREVPAPDLRTVPKWVRAFFHPDTLREVLQCATILRKRGNEFYMACLLGILHHQRPGFLSFPSSHLVPYLRNRKFPPSRYPAMYEYRDLMPRILAKIRRSIPDESGFLNQPRSFHGCSVQRLPFPNEIDCIISSPPYMNALDYVRDNRLRLWFINPKEAILTKRESTNSRADFERIMSTFFRKANENLKRRGYCVLIVGDIVNGSRRYPLSEVVLSLARDCAPSLDLKRVIVDTIPDIRRARRLCHGVRRECVLVFRKTSN